MRAATSLRWLHVPVQVRKDPASGRVWIRIGSQLWGASAQARLRAHIAGLADSEPDLPFIQQITGRADVELEPPERLAILAQRMDGMMRDLPDIEPSMVQARQAELRGLALQIQDRLAAANRTVPRSRWCATRRAMTGRSRT